MFSNNLRHITDRNKRRHINFLDQTLLFIDFQTVQHTVLIFNVIIYIVAALLFGFDRAMYSLLTYFVTSKIIDKVETGLEQAKAAMIITDEGKEIADQIYQKLGRTVTMLEGEGLISGKKVVLYCVLNRLEIYELKRLIKKVDMSAFITVSEDRKSVV